MSDLIFVCRKCGHNLYICDDHLVKMQRLDDEDCPECGEEGHMNWLYGGTGNFDDS